MKVLLWLAVCVTLVVGSRIENNFSNQCAKNKLSEKFYYYESGKCYPVNTFSTPPSCQVQDYCYCQGLEWSDLIDCYTKYSNASISFGSGSFKMGQSDGKIYKYNYASANCTGLPNLDPMEDCTRDVCGRYNSWFPKSESSDNSGDGNDYTLADIVGLSAGLGSSVIISTIVIVTLVCCCLVIVCVLSIVIFIMFLMILFFVISLLIRWRNVSKHSKSNDTEMRASVISEGPA